MIWKTKAICTCFGTDVCTLNKRKKVRFIQRSSNRINALVILSHHNYSRWLSENKRHHEQTDSVQRAFTKQVGTFCQVFEDHGNPFVESNKDLIVIDTRDIVDESVVETLKTINDIGKNNLIHLFSYERNSYWKDNIIISTN